MKRAHKLLSLSTVMFGFLSGCGDYKLAPVNAYKATYDEYVVDLGNKKVDVLFVIDSSGSMSEEQKTLSSSISDFIRNFTSDQRVIDYHIGVTTTDTTMYSGIDVAVYKEDGVTQVQVGGQDLTYKLPVFGLYDGPGSLFVRNALFDGSLMVDSTNAAAVAAVPKYLSRNMGVSTVQERFKRDAMPGIDNSGYEAPFLSLTQFLQPNKLNGWNAGFLRSDSLFSVIVVSDEDESVTKCDANSVDSYLRSQACLNREAQFVNGATDPDTIAAREESARRAYIETVPEAKTARMDAFRNIFKGLRGKRLSLLSLDVVVARDAKYPNGTKCSGGANYGKNIIEMSQEFNRTSDRNSKVHNLCVANFADSIKNIGATLANAVEDEFELDSEKVDPATISVEVNGQLLKPSSFTYKASTNTVKINDFEIDVGLTSGKLTVRIYYDKWIDLTQN